MINNKFESHNTCDLIYFYTKNSSNLTTSTLGSYEIMLPLIYKSGYTPFFLSCNFVGATGLSLNSVNISSDKKTAYIWYNVERNESRNFIISLTYFLIKDAR